MHFLNKITFLDSSGIPQPVTGGSSASIPDTNALRDSTGRFQVGNTDVSSTDTLVVVNKNYVDGRISYVNGRISAEATTRQNKDSSLEAAIRAEATTRQNKDSSLEAAIRAVDGSLTIDSSYFDSLY